MSRNRPARARLDRGCRGPLPAEPFLHLIELPDTNAHESIVPEEHQLQSRNESRPQRAGLREVRGDSQWPGRPPQDEEGEADEEP